MFQVIDGGLQRTTGAATVPQRSPRHPDATRLAAGSEGRAGASAQARVVAPQAPRSIGRPHEGWIADVLAAVPPGSRILGAYELFLLEREGCDLSPRSMEYYELQVGEFVGWLAAQHPEVASLEDVTKEHVSVYRVYLKTRPPRRPCARGQSLSKEALVASQRALRTFFGWARDDGYAIEERILHLKNTKLPQKEADLFHIRQMYAMLDACRTETERLALRIFVGTGARLSEAGGISIRADDGLPDLMTDSLDRGHADLRLRWATTKGLKTRRVRVCPRLVVAIRRYESRYRPTSESPTSLISERTHRPFTRSGLDTLMDRLQRQGIPRARARVSTHLRNRCRADGMEP